MEEVSKVARVKFKYIVSVYGVCSEATGLVMEHMSNGSLSNLLSSHTLMWPKKLQMVYEISMGVGFLHGLKPPVPHLNLKTSNVLLDDRLHVKVRDGSGPRPRFALRPSEEVSDERCPWLRTKISDFALIRWEEGTSQTLFMESLTARGNISYIAPETFTQSSDPPGTASDVYR